MSTRRFVAVGLLLALFVAGVVSFYASSHPDGLEHVAEQTGFLHTADESATADSPLADYSTKGVDDPRLSGGIAGVAGSLVVLALAGGLFMLLRRRGDLTDSHEADSHEAGSHEAGSHEAGSHDLGSESTRA